MSPIIEAKDISIKFKLSKYRRSSIRNLLLNRTRKQDKKELTALDKISFSINKGDILGVVGKNGSGKSTLLRTIAGVYLPDGGTLKTKGSLSSLLSLNTGFKNELSGLENIFLTGVLIGFKEKFIKSKLQEIIDFSELGDFIYQPVKNYSSGMKSRLGFSIAITLRRDIMMIDEILGVGDFKFQKKSQDKMIELIKDDTTTIILVSHDSETIKEYTNKCLWIDGGVQRAFGETDEVLEMYLAS